MDLKKALNEYKPQLEAAYRGIVTSRFEAIQKALGPMFKGVYNDWQWARIFRLTVAPNTSRMEGTVVLNETSLDANAKAYAAETVVNWEAKITEKMAGLNNVTVHSMTGCSFLVTGSKAGKSVSIEQSVILNISSKGLLFNQFPARIYVEGKFMSEAKFKQL